MNTYAPEALWLISEIFKQRDRVDESTYNEVIQFLYYEAKLLDWYKFDNWLNLLDDDIEYIMFARTNKKRSEGLGILENNPLMIDNKTTLTTRVKRLGTVYAWGEDPPSRSLHSITNVSVFKGERENEVFVEAYVILYRHRRDHIGTEVLPYMRYDKLRKKGDSWKIFRRYIIPIHTVIPLSSLPNFY